LCGLRGWPVKLHNGGIVMRSFVRWCGLLALGGLLLLSLASLYGPSRTPAFDGSLLSSHSMTVVAFPSLSSVVGGPSLSAAFIDRVLARYGSPAVGLGRALVADSQHFRIDDAYALAFFLHESTFGTSGVARVTHSLGNIICSGYATCFQGFRWYASWQVGAWDWFRLIKYEYLPRGLTTVQAIVPVYAPASAGNNPAAYIAAVVQAVATWHTGRIWV
jgi:hypothetical protein